MGDLVAWYVTVFLDLLPGVNVSGGGRSSGTSRRTVILRYVIFNTPVVVFFSDI